jgi:hypothetical protein
MPDITTRRKSQVFRQPKLGETRRDGRQTYVGEDHPLAEHKGRERGWVLTHRLDAYNALGGVARCDDRTEDSPALMWRDVRVVEAGVFCHYHGRVRSFAQYLLAEGCMTSGLARELDAIMPKPCRVAQRGGDHPDSR